MGVAGVGVARKLTGSNNANIGAIFTSDYAAIFSRGANYVAVGAQSGRVEDKFSPALSHQTMHAVFPRTIRGHIL